MNTMLHAILDNNHAQVRKLLKAVLGPDLAKLHKPFPGGWPVPVEIVVVATTGELTEACSSGAIDIGFMPADEERRKRVDFSPPYFVIESTYLAAGASDIKTLADVDRHRRLDHHTGRRPHPEEREGRRGEIRR